MEQNEKTTDKKINDVLTNVVNSAKNIIDFLGCAEFELKSGETDFKEDFLKYLHLIVDILSKHRVIFINEDDRLQDDNSTMH